MQYEHDFRRALVLAIRSTNSIAQPIETGITGLGVPDIFIRTSKVSVWLELKNYKYPVHYPLEISFRPGQIAWLERHYKLGGISILGVATPIGKYFFVNKNIKRKYSSDLKRHCDFFCINIIGNDFVSWLDNLQDNH